MTVKVIIHRKVKRGKESGFSKLLGELRRKAISAKGYIAEETLRSSNDYHNWMVISTWHSVGEWKNSEKNLERKKVQAKIENLMGRPTNIKIYQNA